MYNQRFFSQRKGCRNSPPSPRSCLSQHLTHLQELSLFSTLTHLLALPPFREDWGNYYFKWVRYSELPASCRNQGQAEIHKSCMHIYTYPSGTCIQVWMCVCPKCRLCSGHTSLYTYVWMCVNICIQQLCISAIDFYWQLAVHKTSDLQPPKQAHYLHCAVGMSSCMFRHKTEPAWAIPIGGS